MEPAPYRLPRYVLMADFESFTPVKQKDADCSSLVICWFANDLGAASDERIQAQIKSVDWEAHAQDGEY